MAWGGLQWHKTAHKTRGRKQPHFVCVLSDKREVRKGDGKVRESTQGLVMNDTVMRSGVCQRRLGSPGCALASCAERDGAAGGHRLGLTLGGSRAQVQMEILQADQ